MTTTVSPECQKAMDKAKIQMLSQPDTTFFTTVLFSLKHVWDERIPTACTNGKWIRYNPDFFMKQSPKQQLGLMLHETFHVVWMHMLRLGDRCPMKWNMATDYVINLLITDRGFELPKGALLDEKFRGMSAEEVYDLIPDPDPNEVEIHFTLGEPGESGDGDPADGQAMPVPEELAREIEDILIKAQLQSKMAGDKPGAIPGEIELYLDRLLKPKLPTAVLLRKYLHDFAKNDYSWRRPNRRYFPQHHLPSLYSEALGHIAVAVDASGSVSDEEFQRFVGEVGGILRQMRPKKISLITFDTRIRQIDEVHNLNELSKITFTGRGGTDIHGVLNWIDTHQPKVTLVFSDGYFRFANDLATPKTPIVWLIHDNADFEAPFGRVMHYDMED